MNKPLPEHLQELLWRRKLTAEEQAALDGWLAQHPEVRAAQEDEPALTAALQRLPDVPVATNFTARVLEARDRFEREQPSARPVPAGGWRWFAGWIPRAAVATLVLGLSLFGWHQHRVSERAALARSMAENIVALGPDVFENFSSIQRVNPTVPDQPLLHALELAVE